MIDRKMMLVLVASAAVVASGCEPASPSLQGESTLPAATQLPAQDTQATRQPQPVSPTPLPAGGVEAPAELVQQALADLTTRIGANSAAIEVMQAIAMSWSDGSLGCPRPDVVYEQVPVDGYQIILSYEGQVYDYRANARSVFLCESPVAGGPRSKPQPVAELRLLQSATADLAQRLGISTADITPEPLAPRMWPDASLGCPQAGQVYAPAETKGYLIVLKVGQRAYTYHTDMTRAIFCGTQ